MISPIELIRRFREESAYWKRQLKTDYVNGILQGLFIALQITQKLSKKK